MLDLGIEFKCHGHRDQLKIITIHHECPCRIGKISSSGLEFQPGTRQASSLEKIPTPRVRFPYPTWTLMMDCYNL